MTTVHEIIYLFLGILLGGGLGLAIGLVATIKQYEDELELYDDE